MGGGILGVRSVIFSFARRLHGFTAIFPPLRGRYVPRAAATSTLAAAFLLVLMPGGAKAANANGPSFDCKGVTGVAAVVCATPDLAAADQRMAVLYAAAQTDVLGYGPSDERRIQREWLKTLNTNCDLARLAKFQENQADCVRGFYDRRLQDLAIAAFMSRHDMAMAELRRIKSGDAPIYDAIYFYVTTADPKARTVKVANALAPIYAALKANGSALAYAQGPGMLAEAAASDGAFTRFLQEANSVASHQVRLPCAVLAKHPGLIDALSPMYGSSMDGRLPDEDCADTAPHIKALDALISATDATPCDGSIRFAGYRALEQLRVMAVLHIPEKPGLYDPAPAESEEGVFRRRKAAAVTSAIRDVSAYYVSVFHLDRKSADRDAAVITDAMISQAYNICS